MCHVRRRTKDCSLSSVYTGNLDLWSCGLLFFRSTPVVVTFSEIWKRGYTQRIRARTAWTHTVLKLKMADEEVFLTTGASEDNVCISLWGVNSGILLKSYKGGSCPSRSVCLLGKDFILASQVNKSVIHVWHTAKVSNSEVSGAFGSTVF